MCWSVTYEPASLSAAPETIEAVSESIGEVAAFAVEAMSMVPTVAANGFKKLFFMTLPH